MRQSRTGLALLSLLLLLGCAASPPESAPVDHGGMSEGIQPKDLTTLPDFAFRDLAGGVVSSDKYAGKVLLVDVWATWCPPCKQEMPWFQELQEEYGSQGFEVIGISIDPSPADAARFAEEIGISYQLLSHPEIMREWGLLGLPTTFVVDRSGTIRRKVVGFEYKETFKEAVRELL
jgi:cytochrome c biogenesis protein CcmG/thiol:disulfide interchange protein DsbE